MMLRVSPALRVLFLVCVLFCLISPSLSGAIKRKKYSDRELSDLEDQWAEDEEDFDPTDPTRWHKDETGQRVPPTGSSQPKSEMAFVSLKRPITKKQSSTWGGKIADILTSGGVEVKAYPVEAGKVLFVCEKGINDMLKVKHYVLKQRDMVLDFEWSQKKHYPQQPTDGQTEAQLDEQLDLEEKDRLEQVAERERQFHQFTHAPGAPKVHSVYMDGPPPAMDNAQTVKPADAPPNFDDLPELGGKGGKGKGKGAKGKAKGKAKSKVPASGKGFNHPAATADD